MNWKVCFGGASIFMLMLYFLSGILQAIFLIPYISGMLMPLGISKYFAIALAIPLFFWLNCGIGKIFSLRSINRLKGLAMVLGVFLVINLLLGIQTSDDLFDREAGTPNFVYSSDNTGIKVWSKGTNFDPETGEKTKPLTVDVIKTDEAAKKDSWQNGGLREMGDMYKTISRK